MTLLLDVDCVLRDIVPTVINIYKREYDPNCAVKLEDIKEYEMGPLMPKCQLWPDIFIKHGKEVFLDSPPYETAAWELRNLKLGFPKLKVVMCTDQAEENKQYTLDWLKENEFLYDDIVFTRDKHLIAGQFLVDDRAAQLETFRSTFRIPICYNQPWNHNWHGLAIDSLSDLVDIFHHYKGNHE
jgi:5'(3')-deoxyribonucleotidase